MSSEVHPEPDSPKPKRRWFQFGLRTLLGLTAVAAVGMGIWAHFAERQRRAVAAVRSMGGTAIYNDTLGNRGPWPSRLRQSYGDDYFATVVKVRLSGPRVTDGGLKRMVALSNLEWLYVSNSQVTDAGLEHLKRMTKLEVLNLGETQVTDARLVHLKGLAKLKRLDLTFTNVSDAGVAELQEALPNCQIYGP